MMLMVTACAKINTPDFTEDNDRFPCSSEFFGPMSSLTNDGVQRFTTSVWYEASYNGDEEGLRQCIESQATPVCFLLYAMYNNRPDLCERVPEFVTITWWWPPSGATGLGGGYYNASCAYRETCRDYVRVFND